MNSSVYLEDTCKTWLCTFGVRRAMHSYPLPLRFAMHPSSMHMQVQVHVQVSVPLHRRCTGTKEDSRSVMDCIFDARETLRSTKNQRCKKKSGAQYVRCTAGDRGCKEDATETCSAVWCIPLRCKEMSETSGGGMVVHNHHLAVLLFEDE